MLAKLCHKALAESHNFTVRFAFRIEICAALAAAYGQAGERVFKNLFKSKEFYNAEIYRGMKAQAALLGANSAVKLHAETAVYLHLAVIVHPGHPEHDLALGLHNALQNACGLILGVGLDNGLQRGEHLGGAL